MPPFSDSVVDVNSRFRQGLFKHGLALRLITQLQYAQNTLRAPVPADQQTYIGEHPYENALAHLILTSDLRQLHLKHAQLYASGVANWVSWDPAGPKTIQIWDLLIYKAFHDDLVQVKAGYVSNDLEFVGMLVGGSTATPAQGVYAVLPNEVGMTYFPLATPSLNLRLRGPKHTYFKTGAQRSLDAAGGPASVARNHTGFRFAPKGDKVLQMYEVGYQMPSTQSTKGTWLRAGYMRNSTHFENFETGKMEPGNHFTYALADQQLRKPDPLEPGHGLYAGVSAMTASSRFNPYDRYFEARLYDNAPFPSRPLDMAALVAAYAGHSKYYTDALVAAGKTVWRNEASLTASYALHFWRGNFLTSGLSYVHGPSITPRVKDALTVSATYVVFSEGRTAGRDRRSGAERNSNAEAKVGKEQS
ncbi:MAG TPA: carbohydrate porin [Terracidiphilus sp.]|nr:carbohydrate porin [Terracidiphilus sp.]